MTAADVKARLYRIMEEPLPGDRAGRAFNFFIVTLILANVAAVVLESDRDIEAAYRHFFAPFETFSVAVFTIEYALRIWIADEAPKARRLGPAHARARYMISFLGIVDLLAILPFYVGLFIAVDTQEWRILRLLRVFKLAHHSAALQIVGRVLYSQRRPLGAAFVVLAVVLVFAGTAIHILEADAQPKVFDTIPKAMWWTIVTLTTLGYGDVVPVTAGGKVFGGMVAVTGILMLALPTGILANGFAQEIRKRDFVVTWRLVAQVPLFTRLDAVAISDVAALLKPKLVPPHYTIVRRGEHADSMYFIVSGEVEVDVRPTPLRLKAGDFFGEIALLKECDRTATVTAVTECQLFILEASDFRRLLRDHPTIAEAVTKVMTDRLAQLEHGRATA
jgi:voltage-gated potassium channel